MPRSVAYVLTHHPCAAQTFVRREIDDLARLGVPVVPIALNRPDQGELRRPGARDLAAGTFHVKAAGAPAAARALARAVRLAPWAVARQAVTAGRGGRSDVRRIVWRLLQFGEASLVWDHCRAHDIDHLHAHFTQASASVARFAAAIGTATGQGPRTWSMTVHGVHDVVDTPADDLADKVADAEFTVCVCDWLRAQVLRVSDPVDWPKVTVVRCGVDIESLAEPTAGSAPRPGAATRIVCVGRLSPEKGQLVLVEAAALLRAEGRDIVVELIGGGPDHDRLAAAIGHLGLHDVVHLTGALDPADVILRLRGAGIACCPSFGEGIPVAVMEAMALGVPVVATAVGGVPELARDRCTALTVAPGDAVALAAALRELLDHPELAARLSVAARCAVARQHTARHNVRALAERFGATGAAATDVAHRTDGRR